MARARPLASPLVTWRDGIHISGTPIWCDARRARDVCFVSAAHALGNARHGQLIATAPTLALLGAQSPAGAQVSDTQLSVPYGRPFTLGTVRLELIRSGHGLGSASLVADVAGRRVLYASMINVRGGGLGGTADVRQCDALVVAAPYGDPRFGFPPVDEVSLQVMAFVQEVTTAGGTAALLLTSPSKALDVASRLADLMAERGLPETARPSFFAHRSYYEASRRLRPDHAGLPRVRRASRRSPTGHVLLWPAQRRASLPELSGHSRVALVSGRALDPEVVQALAVHAAFPWSNQADHEALLAYIDSSGAEQVFLTHRYAEALAERATGAGRWFRALGPPRQMSLFE